MTIGLHEVVAQHVRIGLREVVARHGVKAREKAKNPGLSGTKS